MNTNQPEINYILQNVPGCIYWKDVNGVYLGCNRAEAEMLGLNSPEEIIGKTDYQLPWKNVAAVLEKTNKQVIETKTSKEVIETITLAEGKEIVMLTRKSPLYNNKNNVIGIIGVSIDITERKIKEDLEAKLGMQSYVNNILQYVPGCIYWKDIDGVYLGCNQAEAEMLGLNSPEKIIGKTDYDILSWKYEVEILKKTEQRIMQTRIPEEIIESGTLVDGKNVVLLTKKSPLYDDENNVIGIIGVSIDITERREKEKLEIKLKLQEKLYTIAKEVVHDIASPVSTLKIMEYVYKDKLAEKDLKMLSFVALSIENMSKKLMERYRDVKDFDKGEATLVASKLDILYVSPYACLHEVIGAQQYQLKPSYNVNFYPDEKNKMIVIKGDYFDLSRVITNLLNNSVEALESKNGVIDVSFSVKADKVEIRVKDNGKGMPQEMTEKMMCGIEVDTTKSYGHGIGMQQIRRTIKDMNGQLSVKSQENVGSEFVITFPKTQTPKWIAQQIELNKGDTVIVLDEDIAAQEVWKKRFVKFGNDLTVKYFSSANDAMDFISALEDRDKSFLITEYKFRNQDINGIDVIEKSGMQNRSVLTTLTHIPKIEGLESFIGMGGKFLYKLFLEDIALGVK